MKSLKNILLEKLKITKNITIKNNNFEENELLVDMLCYILGVPQISEYNNFDELALH